VTYGNRHSTGNNREQGETKDDGETQDVRKANPALRHEGAKGGVEASAQVVLEVPPSAHEAYQRSAASGETKLCASQDPQGCAAPKPGQHLCPYKLWSSSERTKKNASQETQIQQTGGERWNQAS